jgi:hypothetical protein
MRSAAGWIWLTKLSGYVGLPVLYASGRDFDGYDASPVRRQLIVFTKPYMSGVDLEYQGLAIKAGEGCLSELSPVSSGLQSMSVARRSAPKMKEAPATLRRRLALKPVPRIGGLAFRLIE